MTTHVAAAETKGTNGARSLLWTVKAERQEWISEVQAYGTDDKGRAVGGYAHVAREPVRDRKTWEPTGEFFFALRVYATRNGKPYGASPRNTPHATLEEAQAAAEPKLAAQRARYAQKLGGAK